jgi:hypothetical protein
MTVANRHRSRAHEYSRGDASSRRNGTYPRPSCPVHAPVWKTASGCEGGSVRVDARYPRHNHRCDHRQVWIPGQVLRSLSTVRVDHGGFQLSAGFTWTFYRLLRHFQSVLRLSRDSGLYDNRPCRLYSPFGRLGCSIRFLDAYAMARENPRFFQWGACRVSSQSGRVEPIREQIS